MVGLAKRGGGQRQDAIVGQTPAKLDYALEFPDVGMAMTGAMELSPAPHGVKLAWSTAGDLGMNPVNRWFGLFLDRMIGPDFERGLSNLKTLVEKK